MSSDKIPIEESISHTLQFILLFLQLSVDYYSDVCFNIKCQFNQKSLIFYKLLLGFTFNNLIKFHSYLLSNTKLTEDIRQQIVGGDCSRNFSQVV